MNLSAETDPLGDWFDIQYYERDFFSIRSDFDFEILSRLLLNQEKIQSRNKLLQEIWGEAEANLRALDSHVTSLRKKIRQFSGKITTIYGQGYMLHKE